MYSPLTNCFLRPRSSAPASPSAAPSGRSSASSSNPFPAAATATSPAPSASEYASFYSSPSTFFTSPANLQSPPSSSPFPPSSTPRLLSPFPSPFALNVPLEHSSYHCVATSSALSSSLHLSGELLYSGSTTGDIAVYAHLSLNECARFGIGNGAVKALLVTHDRVVTAHHDHKIRVWRRPISARNLAFKLLGTLPSIKDFLLNALTDGNYVQIRRHHRRLWIQHVDTITALAAEPDGSLLYSASWDRTVKVWKLSSLRCIQSIKAHDDAVNAIVVGADDILYTASADNTIKLWRKVGQLRVLQRTVEAHRAAVNALSMRADGSVLYSAGSDCCINVWERESGGGMKLATTLRGHRLAVLCLAVSGPLLCSGSADKTIRVWRKGWRGGGHTCVAVLEGHSAPVKCVGVGVRTFRSCVVASGGLDASIRMWSIAFDREQDDDVR